MLPIRDMVDLECKIAKIVTRKVALDINVLSLYSLHEQTRLRTLKVSGLYHRRSNFLRRFQVELGSCKFKF